MGVEGAGVSAAAHRRHLLVEGGDDLRVGGLSGARRGQAAEHSVQLVVFVDRGLVETLDVGTAVVAGRQDAVVFELHHRFLDRNATQAELLGDLVAVQAISRPELAGQDQIDHV